MKQPAGYLAELRRSAGLTQEELAERCGLTARAISAIESGRVERPHSRSLRAVADALDLDEGQRARLVHAYRRHSPDPRPGTPEVTPRQLPPRPAALHGRADDLAALERVLSAARVGGPVVVSGLGGIGKTALAVEVCARRAADYPDGCLFANLSRADGSARDPAAVLGEFLFAAGVDARSLPDGVAARSALWRSVAAQRRLLVLLDDPADEAQVRPLLVPDPSAVVIATRSPLGGIDASLRVRLRPVDDAAAAAILTSTTSGCVEPTGADLAAMVRACGGMPLALRLLAARLSVLRDVPPGVLAGRLDDDDTRLGALSFGDRSVRRSIESGLRQLSPRARRLLDDLAGLDLHGFGPWLFGALTNGVPGTAPDELLALGLLEPATAAPGQARHRLHDLVRATVRSSAGPPHPAVLRRVVAWAAVLAKDVPSAALTSPVPHVLAPAPPPELTAALRARVLGDGQQWFAGEWRALLRLVDLARQAGDHTAAGGLLAPLQLPLARAGLFTPLIEVARRCAAAGDAPPLVRACAGATVASVSAELGRYDDALAALDGVLPALAGADACTRANAAYELAWVSARVGDLAAAETAYATAIGLHASIGNDYGEAGSQVGLAAALAPLPHRAPDALAHARRAIDLVERLDDSRSMAKIVITLGRRPVFDELDDLFARLPALEADALARQDLTVAAGCATTSALKLLRENRPAAALVAAQRAVHLLGTIDRPADLADALDARARSHAALGESGAARTDFAATIALREELGHVAEAEQLRSEVDTTAVR